MDIGLSRHLKIDHLRLINAIGEHGQLNKAADRVAITQPAASRMLADIERTVGSRLFDRHPKGMTPTAVGAAMLQRAQRLLSELQDLSREVKELNAGERGAATVGAVTGAAVGFVIPAVQALKSTSTSTEIHIHVDTSSVLVNDLLAGKHDFVLARVPALVDARLLDIAPAHTETAKLVVSEDHPLAHSKSVSLKDLSTFEWVIQTDRTPMSDAVNTAFVRAGAAPPENVTDSTSLLVIIAMLASSHAIAPLASEVANLLIGDRIGARLKAIDLIDPIEMSPYFLIQMKGRILSPVARQLKALVASNLP